MPKLCNTLKSTHTFNIANMKIRTLYSWGTAILLVLSLTNCEKEDELKLRSNENEAFYAENNRITSSRFSTIMHNPAGYERFKIVHISDPHLSSRSISNHYKEPINLIQSVRFANQQELQINALIATGDFISNDPKNEAMEYMKSFVNHFYKDNQIPSFLCTGNHDCNMLKQDPSRFIKRDELNQLLFSDNKARGRSASTNYYYADVANPQGGMIRFISLDMQDQPEQEYNTLFYATYSNEQIQWLGNVALKEGMTDQHSVIILTHYPFQRYSSSAVTYLCDGDFTHDWSMIPEIIEAYRSRSTLVKQYYSYRGDSPLKNIVSAYFDFSQSKGEFICYMGGHNHCTSHFDITSYPGQNQSLTPQKMLLCTNQAPSEIGTVYNHVRREENSLSSNSFCIYAIDTRERKIYITFFGAYKPSNTENYPEIQEVSY